MLTVEKLDAMDSGEIIAHGTGLIIHPWFNDAKLLSEGGCLEDDHRHTQVKWVAVRGNGYPDWAIYHSLDGNFISKNYMDSVQHLKVDTASILRAGAKLHNESEIREFVKCTDGAWLRYRH